MVISEELYQEMLGLALLVLSKNSFVSGKKLQCAIGRVKLKASCQLE